MVGWVLRSTLLFVAVVLAACSGTTGPKEPQDLAAVISIDSGSAMPGMTLDLPLRVKWTDEGRSSVDSIAGFDFLVTCEDSALAFLSAAQGPAISEWEYFTWRYMKTLRGGSPACPFSGIRIIAVRDLDNGPSPNPLQTLPEGTLVTLSFAVSTDRERRGTSTEVGFWVSDCLDNTLVDAVSDMIVYMADTIERHDGFAPGYDTSNCPRKYILRPLLGFASGIVQIQEPPVTEIGDLNLNGIGYEIGDAVTFTNYFIYGDRVWDTDPSRRARQIAASDINRDGEPLTIADRELLVNVIIGNYSPGGTLSPPYRDTLVLLVWDEPERISIRGTASADVTGLCLWIEHPGQDALDIQWMGSEGINLTAVRDGQSSRLLLTAGRDRHLFFRELSSDYLLLRRETGSIRIAKVQASTFPGVLLAVRIVTVHGSGAL